MDKIFLQKLQQLSAGRDITPWLKSLGFTSGAISHVMAGNPPSADLLRALQRSERVTARWLDEGVGAPYHVTKALNDTDAQALLDELYTEKWTTVIAHDGAHHYAVILHQPGKYGLKVKGKTDLKMVEYRIVEVVAGSIELDTLRWLDAQNRANWSLQLSREAMSRLAAGHMGNMELFGFEDARKKSTGLIDGIQSTLHDSPLRQLIEQPHEVAEETQSHTTLTVPHHGSDYDDLLDEIRLVVEEVETLLIERGQSQMEPAEKARLITLVFDHIHTRDQRSSKEPVKAQVLRLIKHAS